MNISSEAEAKEAVTNAADYLQACGIRLPRFDVTTHPPEKGRFGGSLVDRSGRRIRLNMGRYPTSFLRNWFAMHELGHVLYAAHRPLRWKLFRATFGAPPPHDYYEVHRRESWKTAVSWLLVRVPGPHRPKGEPSWYGARAGGEERFCELLGLMWASGDFSNSPPSDLGELWECCWEHGLSRMT
jgi:hypothetical protein